MGVINYHFFVHSLTDFFYYFFRQGKNACSKNPCSHICVPLPEDKYTCLCPDGLKAVNNTNDGKISCRCPDGSNDVLNGTCPSHDGTCRYIFSFKSQFENTMSFTKFETASVFPASQKPTSPKRGLG